MVVLPYPAKVQGRGGTRESAQAAHQSYPLATNSTKHLGENGLTVNSPINAPIVCQAVTPNPPAHAKQGRDPAIAVTGARGPTTCISSLELMTLVTHHLPHTQKVPLQCPMSLLQTTAMWRSPILSPSTLISFESSLLSMWIALNCCYTTILTPNSSPQSVMASGLASCPFLTPEKPPTYSKGVSTSH